MKTIQFLNKKYIIPESWDDVTLKMQMEVSSVAAQQTYVKTLGILAGYTGIPVEELKTAKISDLERVMKSMTFLQTPIPEAPVFNFNFNGKNYVVQENILEQQFQDYVAIQTAIGEYGENKWMVTPYILAIMCKHDKETLDDFDINTRAKEFEELPISIANGISTFFLSNLTVSKSIMMFSLPEVQESIIQSKINELKHSVEQLRKQRGGNLLIRLWTMILRKYIKSLECHLAKYYNLPASKHSKKKWKPTSMILPLKKLIGKIKNRVK